MLDGSDPRPLTPEPPGRVRQWRYADGVLNQNRNRWIGVREDQWVARKGLWRANLPMPFPVLQAGEPSIALAEPILESS